MARRERRAARRRHRASRTAHAVTSGLALPSCGHPIRWHENIPVLGWLRRCGPLLGLRTPISPRYPLVEVFHRRRFAAIGWRFGETPLALLWCGMAAMLIALAGIDWDTTFPADNLTLPLLWAGIVRRGPGLDPWLPDSVWGAVPGYLSLWSVYWLFKLLTGKEGMGFGDFVAGGAGRLAGAEDDPADRAGSPRWSSAPWWASA